MPTATAKRMTKQEFASKTVTLILNGKLDDQLECIVNAANSRRRAVREDLMWKNMEELNRPGLRVRVTATIKPRYMRSHEGVVVDRPPGFKGREGEGIIYVDFGRTFGRSRARYGPVVGMPAVCLEKV